MMYVLTDNRGTQIGRPTGDKREIRKRGRELLKSGGIPMIYLADDKGVIQSYSSTDTDALYR